MGAVNMIIIFVTVLVSLIAILQQAAAHRKIADAFEGGKLPKRGKNVIFKA